MTTWHGEKPIAEAVEFWFDSTCPDKSQLENCSSMVAVSIGNEFDRATTEFAVLAKMIAQIPPDSPSTRSAQMRA